MRRWAIILVLALGTIGCESTHTYTYYEAVRSVADIRVGDMVKMETKDQELISGTVVRVTDQDVVVTSESKGRQRVPWAQIQVIQRVTQKQVIE